MRKIVAAEFITLDGFIARDNGEMDFFTSSDVEEFHQEMVNTQKEWDTLLLGRVTYQTLSGFWPNSPHMKDPVTAFMNSVPKVVVSKTLKNAPWGRWNNATIINSNVEEEITNLKEANGKDIAILGSANLIQNLIRLKLVDEYFLMVYPIVLGKGESLYTNVADKQDLQLSESKVMKSGIIKLRYKILQQ